MRPCPIHGKPPLLVYMEEQTMAKEVYGTHEQSSGPKSQTMTPAPWKVTDTDWAPGYRIQAVVSGPNGDIAQVTNLPDARLIAAAPDLLAACQSIVGIYDGQDDVPIFVQKARRAITKASK